MSQTDARPFEAWKRFADAARAGDRAALQAAFADDALYSDPISGEITGSKEIARQISKLLAGLESPVVEVVSVVENGDQAAVLWIQSGDVKGTHVETHGASFVTAAGQAIEKMTDTFYIPRS